jgi:subtilisin family serine protease/PKD repeat protein
MPGRMSRRGVVRTAAVVALATAFAARSSRVAAQDAPPPALDADLVELAGKPDAGLVDVWVIFTAQPAAQIADELRPGYARLVESARAPALAALARIDPLLPPREERERLDVAAQMRLERALLTDDEKSAIAAAHADERRIVQEMRARILSDAKPECDAEQTPVAEWIEKLPGGRVQTRTVVLDALIARVPASALPDLARAFPGVARIARAGKCSLDLDTSVPTIGAASWTSQSYVGAGESVAVVDTGIDAFHPAFATSSGGSVVSASTVKLQTAYANDPYFADNASSVDDLFGHGTHCAGIVASNDSTYGGVAPGASLLDAKCFYLTSYGSATAYDADIVAATDWAITSGANVLSCSFHGAGTPNGSSPLTIFYDAVVSVSGLTVAVAAGNNGPNSGTVTSPGDAFNVVTVGAFDHNATTTLSDDSIASFSSRGPISDGRRKPDLCAPGANITSTNAFWEGGGTGNDFVSMSGTSMATPHVAGAMALLLSYTSSWQPEALKALLANSCRNTSPVPTSPGNTWGYGALDLGPAYADRTRVQSSTFTSSGATTQYYSLGPVASGARQTIAWNRSAGYASGSNPASGGGTAKALVDLDLRLYDGTNGTSQASSTGSTNDVEQTKAPSSLTDGVLRIDRAGSFPSGQTSVSFALASGANTVTSASPPNLVVSATSAPSDVAGNTQFTCTATLINTNSLRAPTPSLTLTLPSGFSFVGSSATQSVATLESFSIAGATRTASWTVRSGTTSGAFQLLIGASTTGYGATFTSTSVARTVTVDATAPSANAGADITLPETSTSGRAVTLDASATTDNSSPAHALTYAWDTDGDGDFSDTPGSATGVTPTVTFPIGVRTVTLRVTDYMGNVGTDTVVVTITDAPPVANAGPDRSSNEGSPVSFNGSASSDIEGPIASYSWNFGDGSAPATGATPTHVFRNQGVYTVTLSATDSAGQTRTDTALVTVANVAPTANAGPPRSGVEGSPVSFLGSATDPGPDDVLTYSWNFGDGTTGTGATPSHVYEQGDVYTATLTVSDGDGGVGTSTVVVTVANVGPTASAGPPKSGTEGSAISFVGSATDPGSSETLTYSWNFGDGSAPAAGASTSHVYVQNGAYTATLTVTDSDGLSDQRSVQVTVANVSPTASAGGDKTGDEGSSISFNGTATDPGVLDVLAYYWDFGDGATASGASASHVYAQNGVYTATLSVVDGDGGLGTSVVHVTVRNVAPVADAGADASSNEGDPVDFNGSATDAGVLDVLTFTWDFGDGSSGLGAATTHVYAQDGVYTATLTATDDAGASSTSTRKITVANVAPDLVLPASSSTNVGVPFELRLAPTDPSSVDAANLVVTWKIVDAAGAVVVSGAGRDVAWPADKKLDGRLVVDVADDHVTVRRSAPVTVSTPPVGDALTNALALGLAPSVEKQVLLDLVAARALAGSTTSLKSAAKKFAAATKVLAKHGVLSGPLVAQLAALKGDCAAGISPRAESPLAVPATVGSIEDLLNAAPRAGFPSKSAAKLLSTLVELRYAQRAGSAKRIASARKAAAAAALKLPAGAARLWFYNSI